MSAGPLRSDGDTRNAGSKARGEAHPDLGSASRRHWRAAPLLLAWAAASWSNPVRADAGTPEPEAEETRRPTEEAPPTEGVSERPAEEPAEPPPVPEQRPVEPPYQAPSPAERPGPLRPGEDAPPTRVEHDEGVIVLSNRGDTRPRASGEHEDVASESSQPVPAASDAPKEPTDQHGVDPGADRVAHAFRDLEPVRSNRKRSREDDEAGFGWVWGLVGAAVILLVPIGFLLNRGTRAPSTPPITRRSSSSEPPDSTSGG